VSEASTVRVASSNAEQLAAWDGDEGEYWASHADDYDRSVAVHHRALLDVAEVQVTDRVLDIGCGTGQTTRDLARAAGAGSALGVDLSSRMLDEARIRAAAEGVDNATFEQADAQVHPFAAGSFDLALSRTGAMFFGDQPAAFANISRALRPGGRLALAAWQAPDRNEWIQAFFGALAAGRDLSPPPAGAPGPFALAEPDHVRTVLGGAGFADVDLEPLQAPMWFGGTVDGAHAFVLGQLGWMLEGVDANARSQALEALRTVIVAHATADGVLFDSGCWLIRAVRS